MPYSAHTRIRLEGTLGDTAAPPEIFSYGLCTGANQPVSGAYAQRIADAAVAYHGRAATGIGGNARLTEVVISSVGANGRQVGQTIRMQVQQDGGMAAVTRPPQIAYRVSLGTGLRGRSNRGGFYVPVPNWGVDANTFQVSVNLVEGARDSALEFVDDLNGQEGRVCIASSILGNVLVTDVRVGRALDTIRTRRGDIDEGYVTGAVQA